MRRACAAWARRWRGVLGNLKFDVSPRPRSWRRARLAPASLRPVVLLASSREGEEAGCFQQKQALAPRTSATAINAPPVQWLVVPRHPQRFDEVQQLLEAAGLRVSRRSQWSEAPRNADVWLGDSLGEMALYYGLADVALLGGSFAPLGGQNLIEAAACGCPVVMGPHTFNFAQAAEPAWPPAPPARGDMAAGIAAACALAADGPRQAQLAQRCQSFTQTHRGAAQATARAVVRLLAA
jgi:3-deoxy-D-manno-octulosonic-acid transferase